VPDLVFDQSPGDLFVVRLAGNFLDDDGLASLEYAVKFLGAPLLVVVGHTNCGAVDAAIKVVKERAELPGHLPELIKAIEPAVIAAHARHPSDLLAAAIEENVKLNVKRMYDDKPILSEALAAKKIAAVGGVYDIATGKVNMLS
jgi:carbonic anhydrase